MEAVRVVRRYDVDELQNDLYTKLLEHKKRQRREGIKVQNQSDPISAKKKMISSNMISKIRTNCGRNSIMTPIRNQ